MCDQCHLRPGLIPIVDPNNGVVLFICVECASPWGEKEDAEKKEKEGGNEEKGPLEE